MGIIGRTIRIAFKGTVAVTSFGLGLALFARPWPDSPLWAKPMELVKAKRAHEVGGDQLDRYKDVAEYADFVNSPVFQQYARNEDFRLMKQEDLIPEAHRQNQVTQGLLNLNKPLLMINKKEGELVLFGKPDNRNLVALDGKIHNGIILTLLDESLCFCGFDRLPNKRGVTANLKVDFQGKLQPNSAFILTAKVAEARGRKVVINGTFTSLDGDQIAHATCLLVEPRWFKWLNWVELF